MKYLTFSMRDRRLTNEPISTNKGSIDRKMNVLSRCIIKITHLLVGMFSEFFKIKFYFRTFMLFSKQAVI